jgi:hypothetical protein
VAFELGEAASGYVRTSARPCAVACAAFFPRRSVALCWKYQQTTLGVGQ